MSRFRVVCFFFHWNAKLINSRPDSNGFLINPTGIEAGYFRIKLSGDTAVISKVITINLREKIFNQFWAPEKTMEHDGTLFRRKKRKNITQEELIKRKLKLNCDVAEECAKLHTIRIEAAFCD